jgi:uncharacterized protein YlaN (UPF0358 family)
MVHIYAVSNSTVAHKRRREISVAEINLLRKFEGKEMIEDRVERQMSKLHALWFKKAR